MKTCLLMTVAVLGAVPAIAAPAAIEPAVARPKDDQVASGDPHRMVCRSEEVIGTRLRRQKRCMTAQEWYDLHLDNRRTLERVQGGGWKSN